MKTINHLFVLGLFGVISVSTVALVAGKDSERPTQDTTAIVSYPVTVVLEPVETTAAPTTTTTTVVVETAHEAMQADLAMLDPDLPCQEWVDQALMVGWKIENIPQLLKVIWKESRCQLEAFNGHDAGLTQINQIHKQWLNEQGLTWPDDMFIPELNLKFALDLFNSREDEGKCGWQPWSVQCQ